jgi:GNAT superfamily N-acetyltransferase
MGTGDLMFGKWQPGDDVGALYAVYEEAAATDDPDGPVFSQRLFGAWLARGWFGQPHEVWFASGPGGVLGWYRLDLPDKENTKRAFLDLTVRPAARRHGTGTALLEHALARSAANGRSLLRGWAYGGSAGEAFAVARGGTHDLTDVRRVQDLRHLVVEPAKAAPGYSLHTWTGRTPDALTDQMAALRQGMEDAPHSEGAETAIWDADRVLAAEDFKVTFGLREYSVAARHDASGTLAALTQVGVDPERPEWGFQEITVVIREHRGHRLGLAVKREMLSVLRMDEPQLRRMMTDNASANSYMIAVNETLGYKVFDPPMKWYRLPVMPLSPSVVKAQAAKLARVALPVLGDLDVQVEVDPRAEQRLDLPARPGADLLEAGTLGPEHDRLLALALHVELGVHVEQVRVAGTRPHLLDDHGDGVRQFVAYPVKGGLAYQLGDHDGFRLIGELAVRVEGYSLRQVTGENVGELAEVVTGNRRDGNDVRPVAQLADRQELFRRLLGGCLVRFRDDCHFRCLLDRFELVRHIAIAGTDAVGRRHAEADDVHLGERGPHQAVQALAEQGARLVQPGRVHQDKLRVGPVHDAAYDPPGGLRTVAGDRHLRADEGVREGGLADVRPAGEAGKSGAKHGFALLAPFFGGDVRRGHVSIVP